MEALQQNEYYTYADYAKWPDDGKRYELIDGLDYEMLAAPATAHQRVSSNLHGQLWQFLKGKPCEVFHAPFDVCLFAKGDKDHTVVQPDILVVCDSAKLDGKRCNGAPDMVIEITSTSTASRDRVLKFNQYLKAGVREYWIVDPDNKTVSVHILKDGEYLARAYAETDTVPVHVLEDCTISLPDVFVE